MKKTKKYLAVSDCITMSDAEKIRNEEKDKNGNPVKKIKTMNRLAREMIKGSQAVRSHSSIYTKLYRLENDGFIEEPELIIKQLMKILKVTKEQLVKNVK